ncbi:MAG TPA: DUF808 domain-containing protein [Flavobacteriales bacterium]|nr:DUF808 domain-containing protein [Flavobacteriales bacterium]
MASSFFALFDDIALLMDDVATMGKVAAKKTAGILGDDLAVNADKASGFVSDRELPVLWQITKGSIYNKLIILPLAFLLSAFLPQVIPYILLLGGLYLAYEGAEKVVEVFIHQQKTAHKTLQPNQPILREKVLKDEQQKIKNAIRVDFILSIEIIILALSTVVQEPLLVQILIVSAIAILATVGVYGLVALLVRMDDIGYKIVAIKQGKTILLKKLGYLMIKSLPYIIRLLSFVGTLAMFLVAGGIFYHHFHSIETYTSNLPKILVEFILGLVVGLIVVGLISLIKRFKKTKK